ncbi:putative receptor-like protein kinase [Quercus suber]|uniref:Receptor-like protein kinase n=1 Tax=Quercus suber TaxID=58331 RepID=A0AAW0INJ6_QUESU
MEKLQFHKIHLPPFAALLFLLQFLSVAYSLTDNYFINCGSATNANTDFRNFVGDLNSSDSISSSFSFTGHSSAVTNSNQSSGTSSTLYQTARIFRSNSSYEFDIPNNDIYFVRLHFFAFSTPTDLSTALFDVWTSGSSLLLNFTGKNSSNFPIKEFFLPISPGKFNVYFLPRGSSFAFINAIEVFPANDSYIPDEAKQISSAGSNNTYRGLRSWALQTIYRINVGGPKITPENDTLWRNWVSEEDDIYFDKSGNATTVSHPSEPNYEGNVRESISESTAPTLVYQTAAKPKDTSGDFNLTWSFNVDKSAGYLVRVHFCDIISESANILNFSLHVYNNFSMLIDPYEYGGDQLAVPFYIDFVVYSGDSGHLNIRIGPSVDTSIILNSAFLNGLEIMKILGNSGITLRLQEHKKKNVFIIIGSILGGLGLICILVAVFFLVFRCRKPKSIETSDWSPLPGGGSSHSRMTEGTIPNMNLGLKMPFSEIQLATKNFDVKLRIGKGGFGIVYKGTLKNGTKIAVKRSDPGMSIEKDDMPAIMDDGSYTRDSEFLSVAFSLTDNYFFINCGTATNANTDRNFVGDLNSSDSISSSFSFTGHSSAVTNSNPSSGTSSTLYQTARIFRSNSSYEFDIPNNDIYFVRLHFFAFSTPTDLSTALFDVWTSGSSLLLNFTGKNSSNSPIITEFFLPISPGKFNVYFLPRGSSFAFINAIEVFPAVDSYIPDEAKQISSAGSNNTYRGLRSWTLQTIYRINVGGPKITPENDTLWRNWVSEEDDGYLVNSGSTTSVFHSSKPDYGGNVSESISESTAPTLVYQTAAKPKNTSGNFNLTWSFKVDKSAGHLVRVHFCDIISESANTLNFSLHIYNNFSMLINPYEYGYDLAVPFYIDFVVYSDDSGHLNIGIGPSVDTILNSAFLNGLEIMKILGNSGITLSLQEHKKKNVFIIVGSILGGLGLICILVAVFFLVLRCRKPKSIETSDWSPLTGGGSSHSRMTEGTIPNMNLGLKIPFSEIQLATKNFDAKLRIGKGGFGIVYKGTLKNGTKIAVKRSDPGMSIERDDMPGIMDDGSYTRDSEFLSVAYSLTDNYFINCGSATNASTDFRNFVGDWNSSDSISSFSFTRHSSTVTNSNQSSGTSSTLYQTARIFRSNSSYEFDIPNNDIYFVRLHFFAFSTPTDLSTALFDVWTSGSSLLLNFPGKNSSNSPIIKEFFLPISPGKFNVYFLPQGSSFAFINAIEVFPANDSYIPDEAQQISSAGSNNTYRGLRSWALQTIYRINVGGPKITPENDTLWRNWVSDTLWRNWVSEEDDIYFNKSGNATTVRHPSEPNYEGNVRESISESTAPTIVYQTAAKPKDTSGDFNLTWSFNVDKSAGYLVRVHFCDIISESANILNFSLHVYNNFSMLIDPYEYGGDQLAVPFYIDFVVYSDDSGHLNIGIGPSVDTMLNSSFLNGLEIMKILGNSGITLSLQEHEKKNVFIIVGSILGGKPKSIETSDWPPLPGGGSSHSRMTKGTIPTMNLKLKIPFDEIQFATKNFETKLLIGKGGFGNVYRGTLRSGTEVAVKRSEPGSGQGLPEFQTEIMVLSKIRHRHLVSLIGYCDERSEMILVYEFMGQWEFKGSPICFR